MCPNPSAHHVLPHRKYVLHCCNKLPSMVIPSQEENKDTKNRCPTICFHVYINISRCIMHDIYPYEERKTCSKCSTMHITDISTKLYTRKDIVLLETPITEFYESVYIPEIQKWHYIFHMYAS